MGFPKTFETFLHGLINQKLKVTWPQKYDAVMPNFMQVGHLKVAGFPQLGVTHVLDILEIGDAQAH